MDDRRNIMVAMRDRRRNDVEQVAPEYGYDGADASSFQLQAGIENDFGSFQGVQHGSSSFDRERGSTVANLSDYNSFLSTYQRAQQMERTKRGLLQSFVKAVYLIISLGFITGFAILINYRKAREVITEPFLTKAFGGSKKDVSKKDVSPSLQLSSQSIDKIKLKQGKSQSITTIPNRHDRLLEALIPISSEVHLRDSTTPQSKALSWMVHNDTMLLEPTDVDFVQRYSLATFFFASGGPTWTNSYNWLSKNHECDWNVLNTGEINGAGGCDEDGHIVKVIFLPNNNLIGTVPKEISELSNLRIFSVHDNKLRGYLTPTLRRVTSLRTLYLHGNDFHGDINFMCLANIRNFRSDCRGNNPEVICQCCDVCCNSEGFCYPNNE